MSMSPLQKPFVDEFLLDLNAAEAARRAGYSKRTAAQKGYELRQKPEIQDAITAAKAARVARTEVTQDEVVQGLKKEATLEGEGSSHSARVAAWAHLGKHLGIFVENLNVKGVGPVAFVMNLHNEK